MSTLTFEGTTLISAPEETVLDALLRVGAVVPHQCRAGACQSCLLRAAKGTPPAAAQQGLRESLRAEGYFLSCLAPTEDLAITRAGSVVATVSARVERVEKLSLDVNRLILRCSAPFDYKAGQFVSLVRDDGLARSYSLASLPGRDEWIELHIRKVPGGSMSTWVHHEVRGGESVELRGPSGDCFYTTAKPGQPLLLVGTGTGLAPLYAIVQDAIRQGHTGEIRLYHGALDADGLYLVDELRSLANAHSNLKYTQCLASGVPSNDVRVGEIGKIVLGECRSLNGWRVYLCGNPALVKDLRKKAFLAGASLREIHSDAFVPAMPQIAAAATTR